MSVGDTTLIIKGRQPEATARTFFFLFFSFCALSPVSLNINFNSRFQLHTQNCLIQNGSGWYFCPTFQFEWHCALYTPYGYKPCHTKARSNLANPPASFFRSTAPSSVSFLLVIPLSLFPFQRWFGEEWRRSRLWWRQNMALLSAGE